MDNTQKIAEALRNSGYKATPQRITIVETILRSKSHPSAEEIYEQVFRTHPTISLSTVYNTLNILRDMDFIKEITFKGKTRYDPNIRMHVNLICENCSRIFDVEDSAITEHIDRISKKQGFRFKVQHVDFYGTCRSCLTKLNS